MASLRKVFAKIPIRSKLQRKYIGEETGTVFDPWGGG
jgi:hypothetical protein